MILLHSCAGQDHLAVIVDAREKYPVCDAMIDDALHGSEFVRDVEALPKHVTAPDRSLEKVQAIQARRQSRSGIFLAPI